MTQPEGLFSRKSKYQITCATVVAILVTVAYVILLASTDWSLDLLTGGWALAVGFGATHAGDHFGPKVMEWRDTK